VSLTASLQVATVELSAPGLWQWYHRGPLLVVAFIIYTSLWQFLFLSSLVPFPPAVWVGAVILLALPRLLSGPTFGFIISLPLVRWAMAYFVVVALGFLRSPDPGAAVGAFGIRMLATLFLVALLALCADPDACRFLQRCLIIAVLIGVGLNLYELLNPGTFSLVFGRAAGLYLNPNTSGSALIAGMILAIDEVRPRWRSQFACLAGLGVVALGGQSGWTVPPPHARRDRGDGCGRPGPFPPCP